MTEFVEAAFQRAARLPDCPNRFLALAHFYWATAAICPDYVREAMLAYYSTQARYRDLLRNATIRLFLDALREMKQQGRIRPDIDLHNLANRFSQLAASNVFDWATGARTVEQLRCDLLESYGMLLECSLAPDDSKLVLDWISSHH